MNPSSSLLELNTFAWLREKRREAGTAISLDEVPLREWAQLRKQGMDFVWLMGVWKRSPRARRLALTHPDLIKAYDALLPDWSPEDISGSPYAVYAYEADPFLGAQAGLLSRVRESLREAGMRLILDFVPNHLALDHPWTLEDPGLFLTPKPSILREHPEWFFQTEKGTWLAHGRDPYFFPWTDTVQVNFFSPRLRKKMTEELLKIASCCDGVRCDMAMLGLNSVFSKVWEGAASSPAPSLEFWKAVIPAVKDRYPDFIFMAEVYWDLERPLIEAGFDFVYDKVFYDRLRSGDAVSVREHLRSQKGIEERMLRFIENHDEARAASAFPGPLAFSAALAAAMQPGIRFFHQGQAEGRTQHYPVQLGRWPDFQGDPASESFYRMLGREVQGAVFRKGFWNLPEARPAWEGDVTWRSLFSTAWHWGRDWRLAVVNLSQTRARGRIPWPFAPAGGEKTFLKDLMTGSLFERSGQELRAEGLFIDLGPGEAHFFRSFYGERF